MNSYVCIGCNTLNIIIGIYTIYSTKFSILRVCV